MEEMPKIENACIDCLWCFHDTSNDGYICVKLNLIGPMDELSASCSTCTDFKEKKKFQIQVIDQEEWEKLKRRKNDGNK